MIKLLAPLRFIIVIIVGLFVSELISMGTIGVIESTSYLKLSLIDATLMILLATPLLYNFSLRPLLKVISEREAEIAQRKQAESQLLIRTTALETAANGVIVTDRQGRILWANQAFSRMSGYSIDEVLGKTPGLLKSGLQDAGFYSELWGVILSGNVWHGEVVNRRKNGDLYVDEQTITPVSNASGEIENFIAIQQDVTERKRSENIMQARLRLMQFAASHTLNELLQTTLDELEALTNSTVGFFHFLETNQKTLKLQAWSTNTLESLCKAKDETDHYDMDQAGVWADCARQRKPIIHNDYKTLSNRKGLPEGHAAIIRELTVPIIRNDKVVAILGVGNKPQDYVTGDVEMVTALADFAWDVVERKRDEIALSRSEEKFRTLVDWTYDWENWINPQGEIVYISPSCKRITGYSSEEFTADPGLLKRVIHPQDRNFYEVHHQLIHDEKAGVKTVEYRIVTRDGSERWIEHVCRPLFDANNCYLGRRISNRDITERKQIEKEIREHDHKEHALRQTIHTMQMDIARDLHDTVGQNISYLRMKLIHLSESEKRLPENIKTELDHMSRVADESYDLIRGTLAVLHSESSDDLFHLLSRYAKQVEKRSSFAVNISNQGESRIMSAKRMRQLFYIFREALSNIEKHASASQVSIEMKWDEDCLTVSVLDDGRGFDVGNIQYGSHYGLKFMKERVELLDGSLSVNSTPGTGANIVIRLPFENI